MATKEWYEEHKHLPEYKERVKRNTQRWQEANPERYMLSQAKHRAKKNNIPFDIEEEDIKIPDICPILNIPLMFGEGTGKPHSPTLDRINPKLGYTKGNIQVISLKANLMKSSATPEELLLFAKWIYSKENHS